MRWSWGWGGRAMGSVPRQAAAPQAAQRLTRLLRLFIALCTAPQIGLPGRALMARLGVSKATVYRDLGLLAASGSTKPNRVQASC